MMLFSRHGSGYFSVTKVLKNGCDLKHNLSGLLSLRKNVPPYRDDPSQTKD